MKILYDHQVFSLQDTGGASRYHYELARHLCSRDGVEINVHLGINDSVYPFNSLRELGAKILSSNTRFPPGLLRYGLNELGTGLAAGFFRKWEIYHPTLYRAMPLVRAQHIVVTHHDCTHERFPELFSSAKRIMRHRRRLFSVADLIICISDSTARDLAHFYGIDEGKIRVIHHGLGAMIRQPEQAKELTSQLRRPYILYVGTRHAYKNFLGLLEAYTRSATCRDFDLVCVGGGKFTRDEEQRITELGIRSKLLLIPRASEAILTEAYSRAHLFVYPSLYEGFGLPPIEAMSCGCPVLAADSSSIPEICQQAALYFDPQVSDSLTDALRNALGNPRREEQIVVGLAQAAKYHWGTCAEKTLQVYREICGPVAREL